MGVTWRTGTDRQLDVGEMGGGRVEDEPGS